jgi:glycosyltransferase involved in cell wall biosynthesis/peptidoglycan/xylan/chitin deacetylase (PgdA/CDA1 family)
MADRLRQGQLPADHCAKIAAMIEFTDLDFGNSILSNRESRFSQLPLRIGLLMDHPSPHMVPFLDALAAREDCAVAVIYCGKHPIGRHWKALPGNAPHCYLNGISLPRGIRFNSGIVQSMKRLRADVWVVNTVYTSPSTLVAARWLQAERKPWAYMNEPIRQRAGAISALKSVWLRAIVEKAQGLIATGNRARELYSPLLRESQCVESIPYYADLSPFFELPAPSACPGTAGVHFVTSCQMIQRKGLDVLLRACSLLPREGWRLTLAGDGPLRGHLEHEFAKYKPAVFFLGELPYEQRAAAFLDKHVFILPSRWDGWGMVIPEALAAGLPVLATAQVTSAHEFIRDGGNGYILPAEDAHALADKMEWFIRHPGQMNRMRITARNSVREYRPEIGAEKFVRFCERLFTTYGERHKNGHCTEGELTWFSLTGSGRSSASIPQKLRRVARGAAIRASLLASPHRRAGGHTILAYHLVLGEDKKRFEDHLKFAKDHFRTGSVRQLLRSARLDSGGDYYIAMTFDDGFRVLMNECLELLEKYGVKATFFVPAAFVEAGIIPAKAIQFSRRAFYYDRPLEPMRPKDLRKLVELGHEVGSHGISHTALTSLTKKMAQSELWDSRRKIVHWIGGEPAGFAYPYGETASALGNPADWVRESGYEYGVTITRGMVCRNSNPLLLPRHHAEGNWSVRDLRHFLLV